MKTITVLASLAALSALFFSAASFELTVSVLFAMGFAAITARDYARAVRPLKSEFAATAISARGTERFGLAA